ncbi:hypothetical protein [uncultured Cocleimonas sp.]|uniref:hypothetical protein n=1 Tax=uncultured Cocleimonas sp. TaxID=1051587 RepID=UPI0026026A8C|nr:hypothetical protein [uncultured Cocleimonas sp.]
MSEKLSIFGALEDPKKEIDVKIQIGLEQAKAGLGFSMDQQLIEKLKQELQGIIEARQKKE